jgi:hypothetical protein
VSERKCDSGWNKQKCLVVEAMQCYVVVIPGVYVVSENGRIHISFFEFRISIEVTSPSWVALQ